MKILITGICGFVGSTLAKGFLDTRSAGEAVEVFGLDSFIRPGSETNRDELKRRGVKVIHADLRSAEDVLSLPKADIVIDAAANPSVLAGVDGKSSSKSVFDHNLTSTIHLLEYCKLHKAGFALLSTSRVYSIPPLASLPMKPQGDTFIIDSGKPLPVGASANGIAESFSTAAPISLYGASKLTSEAIALEYGHTFNFPVWINRCGVLAGAGQFGRADQGIFAFWINAYLRRRPLKYLGFGGHGYQARDAMHPLDLLPVLRWQFAHGKTTPIFNVGGGPANTMSLRQLTNYCRDRFGFEHAVTQDGTDRLFDIPWMVMDSSLAAITMNFRIHRDAKSICDEIAEHAQSNPNWLELSAG